MPALADALALDDPALLGVCLSGAGPSIAALARRDHTGRVATLLQNLYDRLHVNVTVRVLNAQTPYTNGQWSMVNGQWPMVIGQ